MYIVHTSCRHGSCIVCISSSHVLVIISEFFGVYTLNVYRAWYRMYIVHAAFSHGLSIYCVSPSHMHRLRMVYVSFMYCLASHVMYIVHTSCRHGSCIVCISSSHVLVIISEFFGVYTLNVYRAWYRMYIVHAAFSHGLSIYCVSPSHMHRLRMVYVSFVYCLASHVAVVIRVF